MNATSWVQKQFRRVLPPPRALVTVLDQQTAEGVWEKMDRPQTLWAIYVQESWVRASVDTIKKAVLADGWHLIPLVEKPDPDQFKKAMKLLEAPNDQDTLEDLLDDTIVDLMVFGDSFWEKGRWEDTGELAALYSLDTVRMSIRADEHGNIQNYIQKRFADALGESIEFEVQDIIHFKLNARGRNIFGLSPLQSLLRPVEADIWAQNYNRAFYRNNATPRRMFTIPAYTPPDTVELITQQLTKFKGAENAHRDIVLVGDVKSESLAVDPKDMEFLQQRQFSRDEIIAVMGVPPGLLSIIETGNIGAGSGDFQKETFRKGTVKPLRRKLEGKVNREILREEQQVTDWAFAFKAPDPSEELDRAKTFQIYLQEGVLSKKQVQRELGQPTDESIAAVAAVREENDGIDNPNETETGNQTSKAIAVDKPTVGENPVPFVMGLRPVADKIKRGMLGVLGKWKMRVLARLDREIAKEERDQPREIEKQLMTDDFTADIPDSEMTVVIEAGLGSGARVGINTAAALGGASVDASFALVAPLLSARAQGIAIDLGTEVRTSVTDLILTGTRDGLPTRQIKTNIEEYFDKPRSFLVKDVVDDAGGVIRKGHTRTINPGHWAELTARTESAFAAAQGSLESYKQAGIKQVRWITATSGVDPVLCRPFNRDVFTLDEAAGRIPAHHVCLLPGQKILAPDAVSGSKSLYEGPCVEIRLANGSKLTVTQNHPVLTAEGWTFAKCINPGDQVFHAADAQRIAASINQNDDHMPTLIEDKFKSLQKAPGMQTRTMKTSAEDFHGDGRNLNGYVNVVGPDSLLRYTRQLPVMEFGNQKSFYRALMTESKLSALRHPLNRFDGSRLSSERVMGRSGQSESGLLAHSGHSQSVGLADPSRFNPGSDKAGTKGTAADPRLAREFLLRFSGQVTLQEVSQVRHFNTKSWVFDVHCETYELYTCNGIIVKNCRCAWAPVI